MSSQPDCLVDSVPDSPDNASPSRVRSCEVTTTKIISGLPSEDAVKMLASRRPQWHSAAAVQQCQHLSYDIACQFANNVQRVLGNSDSDIDDDSIFSSDDDMPPLEDDPSLMATGTTDAHRVRSPMPVSLKEMGPGFRRASLLVNSPIHELEIITLDGVRAVKCDCIDGRHGQYEGRRTTGHIDEDGHLVITKIKTVLLPLN
ncbi:hypothetical protein C8R46DRAFT_1206902 [Mycena filopes]|nr:hypothetical protein C8R46DRAFT_1206902 [Mycena filopes]